MTELNKAELRLLEQSIEQLKRTRLELQTERTELAQRIDELDNAIDALVKLLPPEKRIDRLFH